jgi:hypothetical protein
LNPIEQMFAKAASSQQKLRLISRPSKTPEALERESILTDCEKHKDAVARGGKADW